MAIKRCVFETNLFRKPEPKWDVFTICFGLFVKFDSDETIASSLELLFNEL
ncbi:hypothetical protein FEDK69T_17580 [Flavobacterium enshiense DK69]|nr:hypothetical protein FEDK69T_17580 [Flavobacterium enshiense DK69]